MKNKIPKGKLKHDGDSGDGKRQFVVHTGTENFRLEVDTDDVDSAEAKRMMKELIRRWNSYK